MNHKSRVGLHRAQLRYREEGHKERARKVQAAWTQSSPLAGRGNWRRRVPGIATSCAGSRLAAPHPPPRHPCHDQGRKQQPLQQQNRQQPSLRPAAPLFADAMRSVRGSQDLYSQTTMRVTIYLMYRSCLHVPDPKPSRPKLYKS